MTLNNNNILKEPRGGKAGELIQLLVVEGGLYVIDSPKSGICLAAFHQLFMFNLLCLKQEYISFLKDKEGYIST
jgi:hypothetical protein